VSLTVQYQQGAQVLRWAPVDSQGHTRRVTGATYTIVDLRESEGANARVVQASTPAVLDGTTWTLTAAAGPLQVNPRRMALDTVVGLERGRTLLLADTSSPDTEALVVGKINGLEVDTTRDIMRSYAIGSTLRDSELQATFPAATADDQTSFENGGGPFQLTWTYTIDGVLVIAPVLVYITRYDFLALTTPDAALGLFPPLASRVGQNIPPEAAVREATKEIRVRYAAAGLDPELLRGGGTAQRAAEYKAVELMLLWMNNDADTATSEKFSDGYEMHMNDLLSGRPSRRTNRVDHDLAVSRPGTDEVAVGQYFKPA